MHQFWKIDLSVAHPERPGFRNARLHQQGAHAAPAYRWIDRDEEQLLPDKKREWCRSVELKRPA